MAVINEPHARLAVACAQRLRYLPTIGVFDRGIARFNAS